MGWGGGRGGVGVVRARVDLEEIPHWQSLSLLESNHRARQTLVAAKYTLEAANTEFTQLFKRVFCTSQLQLCFCS